MASLFATVSEAENFIRELGGHCQRQKVGDKVCFTCK